ncbi:hypothetical protein [Acidilutibacter cellobiosedens]|nr:hypothetical protein [Acidilutibacter cellobiosedens]
MISFKECDMFMIYLYGDDCVPRQARVISSTGIIMSLVPLLSQYIRNSG